MRALPRVMLCALLPIALAAFAPEIPLEDFEDMPPSTEPEPEPAAEPAPPPAATLPPTPVAPPAIDTRGLKLQAEWWEQRNKKLRNATIGFAATALSGMIIGAPLTAVGARGSVDHPRVAVGFGSLFLVAAFVGQVGLTISAVTWGNHQNHRGRYVHPDNLLSWRF